MRVIIIGAGVMGCATALELAERGIRDVLVLERAVPGAEASSAAAGMLAAQIESSTAEEELLGYVRARTAYVTWARTLLESTGIDIGHRVSGALKLARTAAEADELRRAVGQHTRLGLRAEFLDPKGARTVEPELAPDFVAAAHYPDEAQVDPPRLLRALVRATARAGVVVRGGASVTSLVHEGGRCVGVSLDAREIVRGDVVVLAAGSWSSLVPGIPESAPRVQPIRGQIVELEERPPQLASIVFASHAYVVPRGDGRILCGSTMEDVGYRREVTAGGVHTILGAALAIAPRLSQAELSRSWSNFRPHVARTGGPLVGPSSLPGLFLATGHHRNGILLAKTTAETVADALLAR